MGKGMSHRNGGWSREDGRENRALELLEEKAAARRAGYDDAARDELRWMLEEEKLAGDLYEAFGELHGLRVFDRIARSEDRHFNALLKQAEKIGLEVDDILFEPAGDYVDPELQAMHDQLLAQGRVSARAALEVGVRIERADIQDLAEAAAGVEGTRLEAVYERLLAGSENHLEAFEGLLA